MPKKFLPGWGSHMPLLLKVAQMTDGPILELGSGISSTPLLHYICEPAGRLLDTYENDFKYYSTFKQFATETHRVLYVEDWDYLPLENQMWDVAFIDHAPAQRRVVELMRLAYCAKYIICHDSQPQHWRIYRYPAYFDKFKYRYDYTRFSPHTTLLSNYVDLTGFSV